MVAIGRLETQLYFKNAFFLKKKIVDGGGSTTVPVPVPYRYRTGTKFSTAVLVQPYRYRTGTVPRNQKKQVFFGFLVPISDNRMVLLSTSLT